MYVSVCGDNHFHGERILYISEITEHTKTDEGLERRGKVSRNSFHVFLKTELTTFTSTNSAGYHSTPRLSLSAV